MTNPVEIVDDYLQRCEERDLDGAAQYLAPSAHLHFPGGATYSSLPEMVAAPKAYTWVRKHRDRYIVESEGETTSVVSIGRLFGERHDGSSFEDVRYVDVFRLEDGLIVEQSVWNDLAALGILPAPQPAP